MSPERPPAENKAPSSPETTPGSNETSPQTEEILNTFDTLHEKTIHEQLPPEERIEVYHTLHAIAEQFENNEMLVAYEEGRVPTFASMEAAVKQVDEHLASDPEDPESMRLRKLLSQRVIEIRRWCSKYEQSVVVFHRRKKQMALRSYDDPATDFVKADQDRRRTHDNLMTAIQSLDALITEADELESLPQPIARAKPRNFLPKGYADENPFIFSASSATHEHRDFIRDWALVANLEQKLDAQRAYFSPSKAA